MARIGETERKRHHHEPLADAEIEERRFVARRLDDRGDRQDGECRARAEAGGGEAGGEAAAVGEPLERVAYAGAVHGAGADAADRRGDVEHGQRVGERVHYPADAAKQTANEDDGARPEFIDEVALDRHEPGFGKHENREGDLDGRTGPAELVADGSDEKRPAVLQVGDHRHADDAHEKLDPAVRSGFAGGYCDSSRRGLRMHRDFLLLRG